MLRLKYVPWNTGICASLSIVAGALSEDRALIVLLQVSLGSEPTFHRQPLVSNAADTCNTDL